MISVINLKMYYIARTHRKVVKGVSTCILAVACFVLFSTPLLIYSAIQFVPETLHADNGRLFSLWATTFACVNSSANCLIFYWRDIRLREVSAKVLESFVRKEGSTFETQTQIKSGDEKSQSSDGNILHHHIFFARSDFFSLSALDVLASSCRQAEAPEPRGQLPPPALCSRGQLCPFLIAIELFYHRSVFTVKY